MAGVPGGSLRLGFEPRDLAASRHEVACREPQILNGDLGREPLSAQLLADLLDLAARAPERRERFAVRRAQLLLVARVRAIALEPYRRAIGFRELELVQQHRALLLDPATLIRDVREQVLDLHALRADQFTRTLDDRLREAHARRDGERARAARRSEVELERRLELLHVEADRGVREPRILTGPERLQAIVVRGDHAGHAARRERFEHGLR